MKISVCMNTARDDYAMVGYPEIHIFEYFMRSLREQTYKDFEVVIADVLYDQRSNYFKDHPENFEVKHIPVKPNVWLSKGVLAISTTKNTCLLHATGDIVSFVDDCCWIDKQNLETSIRLLSKFKKRIVCSCYNVSLKDKLLGWGLTSKSTPNWANNNVCTYMDNILDVNGYDEMFDGSRGFEDCDITVRLVNSKFNFIMNDKPYNYQHHLLVTNKNSDLFIKCCHLWMDCAFKRYSKGILKANTIPVTKEEYLYLVKVCPYSVIEEGKGRCSKYLHEETKLHHICLYDGEIDRTTSDKYKDLIKLYKNPSLIFDLKEQRKDVPKTIRQLQKICKEEK